ncbi:MAG: glycine cleavage system protein GcvH [Ilumatobacteraceae bacterium]|nr:glycine cleavage system protein GcvH [Actinomycetota bacterium]
MDVPNQLRYSADHEWVATNDDGTVRIGITDYAQDALGDVVFVDLPAVDARFESGAMCGEVESTKSVSEIYTPLAGVVTSVNSAVQDDPSLLNSDPYGEGWMIEIRVDDASMIEQLLTADAYRALTGE